MGDSPSKEVGSLRTDQETDTDLEEEDGCTLSALDVARGENKENCRDALRGPVPPAPPPSPTPSCPHVDSENDIRCYCLIERVYVAFWSLPRMKMPTRHSVLVASPFFDSHCIVAGACGLARSEVIGTSRLSVMSIAACLTMSIKHALGQSVDSDRSVLGGVTVERLVGAMFHDAMSWTGATTSSLCARRASDLAKNIVSAEVDLLRCTHTFEYLERSTLQKAELLLWKFYHPKHRQTIVSRCFPSQRRRTYKASPLDISKGRQHPSVCTRCVAVFYFRACFLSGNSALVCMGDESARALACLAVAAVTQKCISETKNVVELAHRICSATWSLTNCPSRYGSNAATTFETLLNVSLTPEVGDRVVSVERSGHDVACGWVWRLR